MKLVDSDISDLKSKIDASQKTYQTLVVESDIYIFQAEKDAQNCQTLIAKYIAMKQKNGKKKGDIQNLGGSLIGVMEENHKHL